MKPHFILLGILLSSVFAYSQSPAALSGISVSASVMDTSTVADQASEGNFGPGGMHADPSKNADFIWEMWLKTDSPKTIKYITITSKEGFSQYYPMVWSTVTALGLSQKVSPLVVFYNEKKLNSSYSQPLGEYGTSGKIEYHGFLLYGQKYADYFPGGQVDVAFTDGTGVSAEIAPSTTLEIPAGEIIPTKTSPKVTIEEFSDFASPFSAKFATDVLPQIKQKYGGLVEIEFRNFPLGFYPNSQKASEAAECARAQNRFDSYKEILFRNYQKHEINDLKSYAKQAGLDTERFSKCLNFGEKELKVKKDHDEGVSRGVSGTPTFFIGDQKIVGAQTFAVFDAAIANQLPQRADNMQEEQDTKEPVVPQLPAAYCGDGTCNGNETPDTCYYDCPKKTQYPQNNCNGCYDNGICRSVGEKYDTFEAFGGYYCGPDNSIRQAKETGQPCIQNYECASSSCSLGSCLAAGANREKPRNFIQNILYMISKVFG